MDNFNENQQNNQQPVYTDPVQQNNPFMDNSAAYQQPVNYAPVQAIKPRSKAPIFIAVAAALIAIGVGVFFLIKFLGGSGYEKAERNYFSKAGDSLSAMFGNKEAAVSKDVDITFSFGEGFSKLSGIDLSSADIRMLMQTALQDEVALSKFSYALGDKEILGGKAWIDAKSGYLVAHFPEIMEKYLALDFNAIVEQLKAGRLTNVTSSAPQISTEDIEKLSTAAENWLRKVADKYFELFGDAKADSGDSKTIGGVTYEYDVITVDFTYEKLMKLLKEAMVLLRNDSEFLGIIAEMTNTPKEQFTTAIDQAVSSFDSALTSESYQQIKDSSILTMKVYMNGGQIVGRKISVSGMITFEYCNFTNGSSYANTLNFTMPMGGTYINITDCGENNGESVTGKLEAEISADSSGSQSMSNITVTAEYTDMKSDGTGTLKLTVPAAGFELNYSGTESEANMNVIMGGMEMFTVKATISDSTLAFEPMPATDSSNSLTFFNENGEVDQSALKEFAEHFENYFKSLDLNSVFKLYQF